MNAPSDQQPMKDDTTTCAGRRLVRFARRHGQRLVSSVHALRTARSVRGAHGVRVSARRLVEPVRLLEMAGHTSVSDTLMKELRRVRKAAGAVRDLDVLMAWVDGYAKVAAGGVDGIGYDVSPVLAYSLKHREQALKKASAKLKKLDGENVVRSVVAKLKRVFGRDGDAAVAHVIALQTEQGNNVLAAEPSMVDAEANHAIRVLVKQCRYASELRQAVTGDDMQGLVRCLTEMQMHLGQWNDHIAGANLLERCAAADEANGELRQAMMPLIALRKQLAEQECAVIVRGWPLFVHQLQGLLATVSQMDESSVPINRTDKRKDVHGLTKHQLPTDEHALSINGVHHMTTDKAGTNHVEAWADAEGREGNGHASAESRRATRREGSVLRDVFPLRKRHRRMGSTTRFAAIDVGSNSIHLVMAEISPEGDFTILGSDKDMIQIGKGGFEEHRLTEEAMEAGVASLRRFMKMCELEGIRKIRAVATSAVREAHNGGDFVERVENELGLKVHVISGEQEGKLIYQGVRHARHLADKTTLIVDVGGGSVELIVADGEQVHAVESLKLGGTRLAELFIRHDPPTQDELARLRRHIETTLAPVLAKYKRFRINKVVGTSGSIRCLMTIVRSTRGNLPITSVSTLKMSQAEVAGLVTELCGKTRQARLSLAGLDQKRVDAAIPAAMTVAHVMRYLELDEMDYCDMALREGMIIEYIASHRTKLRARATWPDPRTRSVIQLAARCQYRKRHCEHVQALSGTLFDQLRGLHRLDEAYRELLGYACILHDIGYMISQRGHHKHSYYLIRHGELRGFDEQEVEVIANVARYHRKDHPKKSHYSFQNLLPEHRRAAWQLSALLRVANALDRTYESVITSINCAYENHQVTVRAHSAVDAEIELWTARRESEYFERAFGVPLEIHLEEHHQVTGPTEVAAEMKPA